MEISELWKSTPAIGAAVVAVAGALYKAIKTLLEFNDEYLSKRRFKRYSYLRGEAAQHQELTDFIEAAKHETIFRSTFGRSASPLMASAVMTAYRTGHFSLAELKASFVYSKIGNDGELVVSPGKMGWISLIYSSVVIAVFAAYSVITLFSLLSMKSLASLLVALFVLVLTFIFFWMFGRDARSAILAMQAERKLIKISTAQTLKTSLTESPIVDAHIGH